MRSLSLHSNTYDRVVHPRLPAELPIDPRRTRWLFIALCFYLLSQSYTIPVLPVGPWALWPTLSNFAVILLVLAFVLERRYTLAASRASKEIFLAYLCFLWLAFISYLWYLAFLADDSAKGVKVGIFQIYLLVQFISIFWITAHIPLTSARITILRRITDAVLVFVCASVIATYFDIVPLKSVAPHLPTSPYVAGPWYLYAWANNEGWGTIGYSHAYVAAQILMLLSLRLHLSLDHKSFSDSLLLLISIFACFVSGSRAGLAAILAFAMICWIKKPFYTIPVIFFTLITISLVSLAAPDSLSILPDVDESIERQKTLLHATDAENLSGRADIWKQRLEFLDEKPLRWVFGSGFGAALDSGEYAHMLLLHVVVEMGLVGLFVFAILFSKILYHLYRYDSGKRSIFWVTVALLFSSLTQETFYPSPGEYFLGFYLCSLAIALRVPVNEAGNQRYGS